MCLFLAQLVERLTVVVNHKSNCHRFNSDRGENNLQI